MKKAIILSIIFFNILIQTTVLELAGILGVIPNTSLLLVIAFAMNLNPKEIIAYSLLTGIILDVLSGGIVGMNTFGFLVIAYFIFYVRVELVKNSYLTSFIISTLSIIAYNFITLFFVYVLGFAVRFRYFFSYATIIEIVYNGAVGMIIYFLFTQMYESRFKKEKY